MFLHHRTLGFIIKKEARGEADQLFNIYTKDFGKLEILGRGIRKISSKLRSGAEIFYLSEIEFIQGKTYKTLTDAVLIEKFGDLRKDLKRLRVAYKISEVLDNLIKDQEPDEKIWQLLFATFRKLNNSSSPLIYYYFFWNLVSFLGYQPEIYNCTLCQKKLKAENLYFSPEQGGVICQNCGREKIKVDQKITPDLVKILRVILEKKLEFLFKLKITLAHLKLLNKISEIYYNYLMGKLA